jgi:hypothetical protein
MKLDWHLGHHAGKQHLRNCLLLISLTLAAPAYADTLPTTIHPCDETWIAEISPTGDLIVLSTG